MQSNKDSAVEGWITPGRASLYTKGPSLFLPPSLKTASETNASLTHERLLLVDRIHSNAKGSSYPEKI